MDRVNLINLLIRDHLGCFVVLFIEAKLFIIAVLRPLASARTIITFKKC